MYVSASDSARLGVVSCSCAITSRRALCTGCPLRSGFAAREMPIGHLIEEYEPGFEEAGIVGGSYSRWSGHGTVDMNDDREGHGWRR